MSDRCSEHKGVELKWLPGEPAHGSNRYCPLCDAEKHIAELVGDVRYIDGKNTEKRKHIAELEQELAELREAIAPRKNSLLRKILLDVYGKTLNKDWLVLNNLSKSLEKRND